MSKFEALAAGPVERPAGAGGAALWFCRDGLRTPTGPVSPGLVLSTVSSMPPSTAVTTSPASTAASLASPATPPLPPKQLQSPALLAPPPRPASKELQLEDILSLCAEYERQIEEEQRAALDLRYSLPILVEKQVEMKYRLAGRGGLRWIRLNCPLLTFTVL